MRVVNSDLVGSDYSPSRRVESATSSGGSWKAAFSPAAESSFRSVVTITVII